MVAIFYLWRKFARLAIFYTYLPSAIRFEGQPRDHDYRLYDDLDYNMCLCWVDGWDNWTAFEFCLQPLNI